MKKKKIIDLLLQAGVSPDKADQVYTEIQSIDTGLKTVNLSPQTFAYFNSLFGQSSYPMCYKKRMELMRHAIKLFVILLANHMNK